MVAGHIQLTSVAVSSALQPWRNGLIKMLGIGSPQRLAGILDVPTVAESGVPGYESISWAGVAVPAGTPREIVGRLHAEIVKVVAMPDIR